MFGSTDDALPGSGGGGVRAAGTSYTPKQGDQCPVGLDPYNAIAGRECRQFAGEFCSCMKDLGKDVWTLQATCDCNGDGLVNNVPSADGKVDKGHALNITRKKPFGSAGTTSYCVVEPQLAVPGQSAEVCCWNSNKDPADPSGTGLPAAASSQACEQIGCRIASTSQVVISPNGSCLPSSHRCP